MAEKIIAQNRNLSHGHAKKDCRTTTYVSWGSMKTRCLNKRTAYYSRYGGRGITICDRWVNSFENFLEDMGECPEGMTLDRIDNSGNYEPNNCRWTTMALQSQNRRSTKLNEKKVNEVIALRKDGLSYRKIAGRMGISKRTIESILNGQRWASVTGISRPTITLVGTPQYDTVLYGLATALEIMGNLILSRRYHPL